MYRVIQLGYYESLIVQIESDYNNLKKSFKILKSNPSDKQLTLEFCQDYFYLLQNIKYVENFNQNISGLELPISVRFIKDLNEIKILLKDIKAFLLIY